ncbi:helix-turn-helix domain-containing protein [Pseudonocardia lacus]|uniref:helix-turn-helix domain-containing protein n=1 Tax=Pseudonocardia lacus TaxID=2835865 RepID=UPI001BDD7D26|nr:helix-turn-helix domain-containing protein [Pseudonocardia lacus]
MTIVHDEPTGAQVEWWGVRSGDPRRRTAAWEGVLASTHVGFDVRLPEPDAFTATVSRRRFGALSLVECACGAFSGRRGRAVMGDAGEGSIGLQIVRHGAEQVLRGRAAGHTLTTGAVGLWDGTRPVDVDVPGPFRKRTVIFPRDLVHAVSPRLADVETVPALAERPGTGLLVRYVDALSEELPRLDERSAGAAADVLLELVRAVVEPDAVDARAARREALRARARRYIRANLADPRLAPATVARALAVSLRTLHAAFADTDESVAALVRRSRLARCREDLLAPTGGTVTEIAFRWGFTDATHFSHVFKREYGHSPREARRSRRPDGIDGARIDGARIDGARIDKEVSAQPLA